MFHSADDARSANQWQTAVMETDQLYLYPEDINDLRSF